MDSAGRIFIGKDARRRGETVPARETFVKRRGAAPIYATAAAVTLCWASLGVSAVASAPESPVKLGTATSFAVLAGTTVTSTGATTISGSLGVSPGSAVTGFPPATVTNGVIATANAVSAQARRDLTAAYLDAAGRSGATAVPNNVGGRKLVAGVYKSPAAMQLNGTVTLNGAGNPASVFIFQTTSTLITAAGSSVVLVGGAQACNVFWQVGSSATLGTGTVFAGTILALTSVSLNTGASVKGRVLARNGQVSLQSNVVTRPSCKTGAKGGKRGDTGGPIPKGAPDTGFGGTAHAQAAAFNFQVMGLSALFLGAMLTGYFCRRRAARSPLSSFERNE